jgi:Mg-chelatase subunit ChlD
VIPPAVPAGELGDIELLCWNANAPTPTLTASPTPTATDTPEPTTSPTASVTPKPASTRTASATPVVTVTQIPTAAATATAIVTPAALYLPLALRERCERDKQDIDVALVVDASTSMRDERTSTGRTKLEAAIEAAGAFATSLTLPLDQAAVIAFNSDAHLVQTLTGRQAEIDAALSSIPGLVRQQTRIDRGIEVAHEELKSARSRPGNQAVLILLTDGLANPEPASTAVRRAQTAKNDRITVFTIGLGRDDQLNVVELREMASRPEYFYRAPDGEDLLAIYRTIAVEIPCPAPGFWGQR